ncbi:hypothetical protein HAP94_21750 [Acidithiobacillus ferrivorans]|jgi:hypothetical protein|nr:hypothetical protein [Acidithiobacillus ferrivorans]
MSEMEKIEEQIRKLIAKKEALAAGIPASKSELRRTFLKALPGESFFGLSFAQILGALDVVRTRGMSPEQGAELERLGLVVLKKYVQRPENTAHEETAARPQLQAVE